MAKRTTTSRSRRRARAAPPSDQPMMVTLRAEHRHMAAVMQLFADQLHAIEQDQAPSPQLVYEILDYMVQWPDRFHHPREDLIYSRVAELDADALDDVDTLQRDHDRTAENGRKLLRQVASWRDGSVSSKALVAAGHRYIDHIYDHMNVEEKLVFPRVEAVLTEADWRELEQDDRITAVASPVFGPLVQREYRNLERRLRRRLRQALDRDSLLQRLGPDEWSESLDALALGCESALDVAGEHLRAAWQENRRLVAANPLTAPARCALHNTRQGFALAREVAKISRDTVTDVLRIQSRDGADDIKLVDR